MKSNVFYRGELNRDYRIIEKGKGIYLYDADGNKYLDAMSGIAVMNIGYGVKEVEDAMLDQVRKLPYCYTSRFSTKVQEGFAERIAELSPTGLNKVWFSLSGALANECAIKVARQYHVENGNTSKYKVISRWQSYHGSTLGTLAVSGTSSWRKNYAPMFVEFPKIAPVNCYRCPFGKDYPNCDLECASELDKLITFIGSNEIAAFIAEPIVASSAAVVVPPVEYYKAIRAICDKHNVLFIADEVFTGCGRTGKFYSIENWKVVPDIISLAKGIAGGFMPLGATVIHEKIYGAIRKGSGKFNNGVTFSGHPVACAAGLSVLDYMKKHSLVERARKMGNYLMKKLSPLLDLPSVGQIRGKGLLIGIEFVANRQKKEPFDSSVGFARKIVEESFQRGLLVQAARGCADGIRGDGLLICPPFIINEKEIEKIAEILEDSLREVQKKTYKL